MYFEALVRHGRYGDGDAPLEGDAKQRNPQECGQFGYLSLFHVRAPYIANTFLFCRSAASAAQMTQTGHVKRSPKPKVNRPTMREMMSIMTPPETVEYIMQSGPKRKAKMTATIVLFPALCTTT